MRIMTGLAVAAAICGVLTGCGIIPGRVFSEKPTLGTRAESTENLLNLPGPKRKLYVAVYAFQDLTGQHKPNDNYADYSFAVTQGGAPILINALRDAGAGRWFSVLERNRLGDLLQERQIIRANRQENLGANGERLKPLGPLLNAGVLMEGGIVGYDSNVLTGGVGANYLGIGASTQYRRDAVEVYLRAVSVLTGEVLVAVTTQKTIYSTGIDASINKYVSFNKLLQLEAGFTTNEPVEIAVRQAIEKAVYALILEGTLRHDWSFADAEAQKRLLGEYLAERDSVTTQMPEGETPTASASPAPQAPARQGAAPQNRHAATRKPTTRTVPEAVPAAGPQPAAAAPSKAPTTSEALPRAPHHQTPAAAGSPPGAPSMVGDYSPH